MVVLGKNKKNEKYLFKLRNRNIFIFPHANTVDNNNFNEIIKLYLQYIEDIISNQKSIKQKISYLNRLICFITINKSLITDKHVSFLKGLLNKYYLIKSINNMKIISKKITYLEKLIKAN